MPNCPKQIPFGTLDEQEIEALKWAAGRELELHGGQPGFEALASGWVKLCKAGGFDPTRD